MRANPWCPSRGQEWVSLGDEALPCAWHHRSDAGLLTVYPAEYRAWAGESRSMPAFHRELGAPVAAVAGQDGGAGPPAAIRIANPPAGAIYSVDPTLRREFQALPLRAVTARPTTLTWTVDGATIGTASSERSLSWPLALGEHEIEARDPQGRRARASVRVK